jgi:hypothetical protein
MLETEHTSGLWRDWNDQEHWITFIYLVGSRTCDLPACSIAPQSSLLKLINITSKLMMMLQHTLLYLSIYSLNDSVL